MTRVEEVLFDRMTVRRWPVVVAGIGAGAAGYYGGREHLRHQLREAVREGVEKARPDLERTSRELNEKLRRSEDDMRKRMGQSGGGR